MRTKTWFAFQHLNSRLVLFVLCAVSCPAASCGRSHAASAVPLSSVMQTVREYGSGKLPHGATSPSTASLTSDDLYDSDGAYQAHIAAIFAQHDFAQLEKEAQQARSSKARLKGGAWKLFGFYEGLTKPSGSNADDSEWNAHIAAVKEWVAAYPDSATARIALADSYVNYGWAARGKGFADTVSESGWNTFNQRVELGVVALLDAARVKEKCPYWFEVMQKVALAQGWEKQQARELFERATTFEPSYYHFYREYANFLLPKWYGQEGETQAFAEEMSKKLGEPDSSIFYFEVASLFACQCHAERDSLGGMSWPKVKQGYGELQSLYGTSNLKMNRFAYMSFIAGDKSSAQETFALLGGSWNSRVWNSAQSFESAKEWASTP